MLLDDESTKERQVERPAPTPPITAHLEPEAPPPRLSESEPPVAVVHQRLPVQVLPPPLDPPEEQPKLPGERKLVAGLLLVPLTCLPIAVISVTILSFPTYPPVLVLVIPGIYYIVLLSSLIRNRHLDNLPPLLTARWNVGVLVLTFISWFAGTFISLSSGQHQHGKALAGVITLGALSALGATLTGGLLMLLMRDRRAHLVFSKFRGKKLKKNFPAVAIYLMVISPSIIAALASTIVFIFTERWGLTFPVLTLVHHLIALGAHARHFQNHPSTSPERFGNLPPRFTSLRHLYVVLFLTMGWVAGFLVLTYTAAFSFGDHAIDTGNIVLHIVAIGLSALEASLSTALLAVLVCARHRGSRPLFPSRPDTELAALPVTSSHASRLQAISNLPPARVSTGSLGAPPPAYSASNRP